MLIAGNVNSNSFVNICRKSFLREAATMAYLMQHLDGSAAQQLHDWSRVPDVQSHVTSVRLKEFLKQFGDRYFITFENARDELQVPVARFSCRNPSACCTALITKLHQQGW